jgi:hypothetical protein
MKRTRNHKTAIICLFNVYSIYYVYDLQNSTNVIYNS